MNKKNNLIILDPYKKHKER